VSRQIGPIGTGARAIAGSAAIAYTVVAHGLAAWDVGAGLIAFPILASLLHAAVASAYDRLIMDRTSSRSTRSWVVSVTVLVLILAIGIGLTFVSPIDGGAIFLFFGASLLIVAARGDAGCEVLAVVNAISGDRDRTGCVAFAAVDSLEGRQRRPTDQFRRTPGSVWR
jgi:succinate dehydrogenase hydrophobic anchor subunit